MGERYHLSPTGQTVVYLLGKELTSHRQLSKR